LKTLNSQQEGCKKKEEPLSGKLQEGEFGRKRIKPFLIWNPNLPLTLLAQPLLTQLIQNLIKENLS